MRRPWGLRFRVLAAAGVIAGRLVDHVRRALKRALNSQSKSVVRARAANDAVTQDGSPGADRAGHGERPQGDRAAFERARGQIDAAGSKLMGLRDRRAARLARVIGARRPDLKDLAASARAPGKHRRRPGRRLPRSTLARFRGQSSAPSSSSYRAEERGCARRATRIAARPRRPAGADRGSLVRRRCARRHPGRPAAALRARARRAPVRHPPAGDRPAGDRGAGAGVQRQPESLPARRPTATSPSSTPSSATRRSGSRSSTSSCGSCASTRRWRR